MKRKTEITIETQRLLVVRRQPPSINDWCAACGASVLLVTPSEASRRLGVTTRDIYRRVEAGEVHYTETTGNELLICTRSLSVT